MIKGLGNVGKLAKGATKNKNLAKKIGPAPGATKTTRNLERKVGPVGGPSSAGKGHAMMPNKGPNVSFPTGGVKKGLGKAAGAAGSMLGAKKAKSGLGAKMSKYATQAKGTMAGGAGAVEAKRAKGRVGRGTGRIGASMAGMARTLAGRKK